MRWPGRGLRLQVPCRRRLHNPQRPQGRRVDAVYLILLRLPGRGPRRQAPCRRRLQNHAAKRGVAKAPSAQASRRTERVRRCACAGVTCAHASPLRLKQGHQQREKHDRQRSLCSARAPASWGKSPVLPVRKGYQQRKKGSTRLLVLGVHPPPSRGRSPYCPYAKVISGAKSGPPCTPPHPGQAPLLPVCKSYQQCTKRPP